MRKNLKKLSFAKAKAEAAHAILLSVFEFLESNQISKKGILRIAQSYVRHGHVAANVKSYEKLVAAYDDMGVILSTWFSNPEFLDLDGHPLPLSIRRGSKSVGRLLQVSQARVGKNLALELMKQSPSIKVSSDGILFALRRVFVLTDFNIPRAAFTIERYLDTVQKSATARASGAITLLERSSHVSSIDLSKIAPILRSIEGRGTAFMDSIDGEMEERRLRQVASKNAGELGVLAFAWTMRKHQTTKKRKSIT